jgi:hypothetical protein
MSCAPIDDTIAFDSVPRPRSKHYDKADPYLYGAIPGYCQQADPGVLDTAARPAMGATVGTAKTAANALRICGRLRNGLNKPPHGR